MVFSYLMDLSVVLSALPVPSYSSWQRLLRLAFIMGKKMDNKLRQYKGRYDGGWWKKNRLAGGELNGQDDRPDVGLVIDEELRTEIDG